MCMCSVLIFFVVSGDEPWQRMSRIPDIVLCRYSDALYRVVVTSLTLTKERLRRYKFILR